MIEQRESIINGDKYSVTQMTARRALRMKAKLIRVFGASLAQIFLPGSKKSMDGMSFSKEEAVKALQTLSAELDEDTFEQIIMQLLIGVRKEGVELNEAVIDLEFAGDLATLFKVVWFVLEVNFASFFEGIGIGNLFDNKEPLTAQSVKKA